MLLLFLPLSRLCRQLPRRGRLFRDCYYWWVHVVTLSIIQRMVHPLSRLRRQLPVGAPYALLNTKNRLIMSLFFVPYPFGFTYSYTQAIATYLGKDRKTFQYPCGFTYSYTKITHYEEGYTPRVFQYPFGFTYPYTQ